MSAAGALQLWPRRLVCTAVALVLAGCVLPGAEDVAAGSVLTQSITLAASDHRAVAVRLLYPRCAPGKTYSLLLFSHGANSAPAKYDRLTSSWAAAGYVVAAPLHADSPDHPGGGKVDQRQSWSYRIDDIRLLIDRFAGIARVTGCRIAADRIAATGHSYGALIAQALGGARIDGASSARDPRVRAVVAFSPPGPVSGYIAADAWSTSAVPMLVQTGTADILPTIAPKWEAHRVSFDRATGVPRVLFVGEGVDHYFGNIIGRPERQAPPAEAAFEDAVELSRRFLALALEQAPPAAYRALARPRAEGASWIEVALP